MKRSTLIFCALIINIGLYSQAPEGFTYKASVHDNSGAAIINHTVSIQFDILKGSPSGLMVYSERHIKMTDLYGNVTMIIGNGAIQSGDFVAIDWSSDSYFLKIGLDTTGGSNYADLGITQFLSVPYALFAKSAGNGFSGNYNDLIDKPVTDGTETKIVNGNNITITGSGTALDPYIISNGFSGNYNDLTNIPVTDGSETKITVGPNLTVSGFGTITNPYILNARAHYIGESFAGGIVFYTYDNGLHGLIAALYDQDINIQWYNGIKRYTNTAGDGLGAGSMNTILVIALQTNDNPLGNFAAKVCADFSPSDNGIVYGDWYLPSKYELNLLFTQKTIVGGFSSTVYWSSTEFSSLTAWSQNFTTGYQFNLDKSIPHGVRAIRAF